MTDDILSDLERRLGALHAKQRVETDHEAQAFDARTAQIATIVGRFQL
jgi:hypothetical protein